MPADPLSTTRCGPAVSRRVHPLSLAIVSAISTRPGDEVNGHFHLHRALLTPQGLCFGVLVPTSTERLVETNGVRLRVVEAGDRGAPVVVLAHGFPELSYS